jgi:hypothetical protein
LEKIRIASFFLDRKSTYSTNDALVYFGGCRGELEMTLGHGKDMTKSVMGIKRDA